ncbi:MAG TPA: LacI family DNA-binding transcriptional regulator [Thermoflexales bacterium]|nr:LacI family DNA-binding transcriptional regulator [Thermoflexales bacterium]HQX09891.1 LacI family DNA-binding transcriptional regulator [Thermoflexales bacterium]HQY25686.1 LacI family DNA-binding transcriptional regulator [Thermoflexales bacterium]
MKIEVAIVSSTRDIARKANVSLATVSRILNNKPNVNASTRLLVLHVAQELGYPIPDLARNMMVSRFVPVLIRQNANQLTQTGRTGESFEQTAWAGVEAVFAEKKVITKLQFTSLTTESAEHFASEAGVAGLVVLGGVTPIDFLKRLKDLNMRFVIVGSHPHPLELNSVMADVMTGMRLVVRHLLGKGRRRIGFVNGPNTTTTSEYKLDGVRLELGMCNIPFDTGALIASDFSPESGYLRTKELLARGLGLDAIMYADDMIAIGGMRALREAGYRIPDDVAVTGFGDYDLSKFTSPTLTAVSYDMHAMGRIAATRLYQLLEGADPYPWSVLVPTSLVIRESA